jgi:hypothetical protein
MLKPGVIMLLEVQMMAVNRYLHYTQAIQSGGHNPTPTLPELRGSGFLLNGDAVLVGSVSMTSRTTRRIVYLT